MIFRPFARHARLPECVDFLRHLDRARVAILCHADFKADRAICQIEAPDTHGRDIARSPAVIIAAPDLCLSIATGSSWLGFRVPRRMKGGLVIRGHSAKLTIFLSAGCRIICNRKARKKRPANGAIRRENDMKLNKRNAVWAFALAIAVTGSVTRMFAISQCPVNGQNQTPIASSGILLFNGTGTTNGTNGDVQALESVITNNLKLDYDTVDSVCLDKMSVPNLAAYKLLIIPGGNSITIGNDISTTATGNIQTAVRDDGLHYLGVCAGAFLASWPGSPPQHNDIDLLDGIWFNLFTDSSCGAKSTLLVSETLSLPDGSTIDVYWEDGPYLTTQGGTWGTVVAEYQNGQPAIIQGVAGKGWTLLQGVHPEAPRSWGCGKGCTCNFGNTTQAEDFAYSATLISAALNGTELKHF